MNRLRNPANSSDFDHATSTTHFDFGDFSCHGYPQCGLEELAMLTAIGLCLVKVCLMQIQKEEAW
jgi:hypothetical protein